MGVQLQSGKATRKRAAQALMGLYPTEDFVDEPSFYLTESVSGMTRRARIELRLLAAFDLDRGAKQCSIFSDAQQSPCCDDPYRPRAQVS